MQKVSAAVAASLGGWIGWWLGAHVGIMSAFMLSMIGMGAGMYVWSRIIRHNMG